VTLLLDTCAFIWLTQEPGKLSTAATGAINDPANTLWLSHASVWEMHLKHHAGKLTFPDAPRVWIPHQLSTWKISEKTITLDAIHRTSDLPDYHRDPFDRMLIAQSLEEDLTIVSPDQHFPAYGVKSIW
jgi:PIN domain nuclease of toxin-antitoxin system